MAGDSKTEKATPKRRRDERKKGNVLMSKDAVAVSTLIGSLFMVQMMGSVMIDQVKGVLNLCFAYIAEGTVGMMPSVLNELFKIVVLAFVTVAGPFLAVTALLAMLNSCASGVSVVNIDNGFGAAFQASAINHLNTRGATAGR